MPKGRTDWSGPRIRVPAEPLQPEPEEFGDPANGAPVPRCWCCGVPGIAGNRLMHFGLVYRGKRAGSWRLCERCYASRNPPERADPLQVA